MNFVKMGPDLMGELRFFIAGASRTTPKDHLDLGLARTALSLLKTLPASREAVLEYFCSLFDEVVGRYISNVETPAKVMEDEELGLAAQEEAVIAEVHNVLCDFVNSSPGAWAPIISKWSLQLLGEISSRYAGRAVQSEVLNDSLQLWMSCRATRTLIDITTQCLSCLMNSDTESCINALLDTCVSHSPHFDWVVAHVGSCFPRTVMTRVLSCGLKDFCSNQQGPKAPKLSSVVQILGYLAGSHSIDMRRSLLQLFQWSLEKPVPSDPVTTHQQYSTVPFLIQLASMSPTLLRAVSMDVLNTLSPPVLSQLAVQSADWLAYYGGREAFQDLLVHLVLKCPSGGCTLLSLVLDCAAPSAPNMIPTTPEEITVQSNAAEFLELLLQEISIIINRSEESVPFLGSLRQDMRTVLPLLLSSVRLRVQTALRLIGFIGHQSPSVFPQAIAHILVNASCDEHLANLARLLGDQASISGGCKRSSRGGLPTDRINILQQGLEQALHKGCDQLSTKEMWNNVSQLIRWERQGKLKNRNQPVVKAVYSIIYEACSALSCTSKPELAYAVAETLVLALVQEPGENPAAITPPNMQAALRLAHSTVSFFFMCLKDGTDKGEEGCILACKLFARLSLRSSAARSLALRTLLDGALFHGPTYLFGSSELSIQDEGPAEETDVRLMHENLKQGLSWVLAQRHSSVFHAGVIGFGLRHTKQDSGVSANIMRRNTQLFIDAVRACCMASTVLDPLNAEVAAPTVSLDAVISVSLLLVELISPDVMYNGLPWPDEEGCKATVERDCYIRRKFEEFPVLWELLWFISLQRPALCYCSVILRAITATLIAQWGSCSQQRDPSLLQTTVRLLSILALGQLLPSPLASLRDIVPFLKAAEVVQILRECVWNYMRDHVPAPALFTRDSTGNMWRDSTQDVPGPQHTEAMRLILLANVETLGELYAHLFTP